MLDPVSTYRIQFNKDFTFKDFEPVIPYLHDLGIKTVYASPIYKAVPGSTHGYDVVDPNTINPEIGTIEELRALSATLKSLGMFWIQDIVPNHMGFHQQNYWLMDVLKNGEGSPYRNYFDIISPDLSKDPLMVPFLGDTLEAVQEAGNLELSEQDGEHFLKYFDSCWPVRSDLKVNRKTDLAELASAQYYRLCHYQESNTKINYRRFFTVNSLICLNMQYDEVFNDYHCLTTSLLKEGIIQGLRIDHIDGLADPKGYLMKLRSLYGEQIYIVVEKILESGEKLPESWPVQGTTGYDYLGLVNQLFTNNKAERKFDAFYKDISNLNRPVQQQLLRKKREFLDQSMQGELANLCQLMVDLKLSKKPIPMFKELIAELLVRLPVYRFYSTNYPLKAEEVETLNSIFSALEETGEFGKGLPVFRDILLGKGASQSEEDPSIIFFKRMMQFSGPLMAKGVEDTLMYTYNRFIGNNEVGDSPELFGITPDEFHNQIAFRGKNWPYAMNATATHDTKRGEDARTRLAVLTGLWSEWIEEVRAWQDLNKRIKSADAPDGNDEYFIYQALIATCPERPESWEEYEKRFLDYIEKALRESKRKSGWDEPDLEYESRTKDFIQYLLDPAGSFFPRFSKFLRRVASYGKLASLSALVLKHTLPGIPDTYQGTELWDLSMVDPDNRRQVDYQLRKKLIAQASTPFLLSDNNLKIKVLNSLLQLRNMHSELFARGIYIPLQVKGKYAGQVIAYARQYQQEWLVVAVVLNLPGLISDTTGSLTEFDWKDTHIVLPAALNRAYDRFEDPLSHNVAEPKQNLQTAGILELSELITGLPVAVRSISVMPKKRAAGILMPVTSVPSHFGIGDFGPAASAFLSFLAEGGMQYWQMLPMNPLSQEQSYSPYSSISVMAGNTLLISPEELAAEGLLRHTDLKKYKRKTKRKVDFTKVRAQKHKLLSKAFQTWKLINSDSSRLEFEEFCQQENQWLEDYVLFVLISQLEDSRPWFQWPTALKNRDRKVLKSLREQYDTQLQELRWQQFVFFKQWRKLKTEANVRGIKIIGDLPFYAAHNSVDTWAKPELFALDKDGLLSGIAGVPPDYFNADGQLWGMPVYNWKVMSSNGYQWWIDRILKNMEIYDQLRLDHFRAFSEYWEVPGGSDTAKSGKWNPGPGALFFKALNASTGHLPLIAEDLGEISKEVFQLRDEFNLPGMKVLQFGFGDDLASSIHAPHTFESTNCIVYTGTHDNNTTRGWYEHEIDEATRKRLEKYLGVKISRQNITTQMIRLALSSTAEIAIIPMQDILNKPARSRMNTPASVLGNWTWRLKRDELSSDIIEEIRTYMKLYGR